MLSSPNPGVSDYLPEVMYYLSCLAPFFSFNRFDFGHIVCKRNQCYSFLQLLSNILETRETSLIKGTSKQKKPVYKRNQFVHSVHRSLQHLPTDHLVTWTLLDVLHQSTLWLSAIRRLVGRSRWPLLSVIAEQLTVYPRFPSRQPMLPSSRPGLSFSWVPRAVLGLYFGSRSPYGAFSSIIVPISGIDNLSVPRL